MRKLKLQVQMTIDGFIAGPGGEMDWMTFQWDDELKGYVTGLTESVDTILLGRRLAEGFIPHWAGVAADPENPDNAAGKQFTDLPKVVFSRTLEASMWENTVVASGDLVEEVTRLKEEEGGDLIAYGGSAFVSDLIRHGLVDEMNLFVNPVAIGAGMPIFGELDGKRAFVLETARPFPCGIALLRYRRAE